jgi:hypothetical protein
MNSAQKAKYHGLYCALLGYVGMLEEANIQLVELAGEHSILYECKILVIELRKNWSSVGKHWEKMKWIRKLLLHISLN